MARSKLIATMNLDNGHSAAPILNYELFLDQTVNKKKSFVFDEKLTMWQNLFLVAVAAISFFFVGKTTANCHCPANPATHTPAQNTVDETTKQEIYIETKPTRPNDEMCPAQINQGWSFYKPSSHLNNQTRSTEHNHCNPLTIGQFHTEDKINIGMADELYGSRETAGNDLRYFFIALRQLPPFTNSTKNTPYLSLYWKNSSSTSHPWYYRRDTITMSFPSNFVFTNESFGAAWIRPGNNIPEFVTTNAKTKWKISNQVPIPMYNNTSPHIHEDADRNYDQNLELLRAVIETAKNQHGFHFNIEHVVYQFDSDDKPRHVTF